MNAQRDPLMLTRHDITCLLDASAAGDESASAELWGHVYADVHSMASSILSRERPTASLAPTLVTHEVYLRMLGPADKAPPTWDNRRHFFGSVARAMEQFLIDQARARKRLKRGGDRKRVPLNFDDQFTADLPSSDVSSRSLVAQANQKLESVSPDDAEIVRLKIIAGLTIEQIATAMDISEDRVVRSWAFAKAWLFRELESQGAADDS